MSKIEWTQKTWNPIRGCTRVSAGCQRCYAETMAARNLPGMRSPTTGEPFAVRTPAGPRWTGRVELIPSKLAEPLTWRKPSRVFVNSMSDLFHEALPDRARDQVFAVMALAHWHTFQILTKRPERMLRYCTDVGFDDSDDWEPDLEREGLRDAMIEGQAQRLFVERGGSEHAADELAVHQPLPNVWLGVSVEDQATADARIPLLLQTPAAKRFVSYEPALGPVDFVQGDYGPGWLCGYHPEPVHACGRDPEMCRGCCPEAEQTQNERLDWLIVGGESGPGARPFDVAWARSAVKQCREAGVPVFVKQLGARPTISCPCGCEIKLADPKGGDPSEWPADLRVREFPA